jgi:hypothetical protein
LEKLLGLIEKKPPPKKSKSTKQPHTKPEASPQSTGESVPEKKKKNNMILIIGPIAIGIYIFLKSKLKDAIIWGKKRFI